MNVRTRLRRKFPAIKEVEVEETDYDSEETDEDSEEDSEGPLHLLGPDAPRKIEMKNSEQDETQGSVHTLHTKGSTDCQQKRTVAAHV